MPRFCVSPFQYRRWQTRTIRLGTPETGAVSIGGTNPVVIQSMLNTNTMDTAACVRQTLELVKAGCQLVRLAVPTVAAAANLKNIVAELRARGCTVPVIADVHFKPEAALEAVKWADAVRINPGNYTDRKKFVVKEYSETEYDQERTRAQTAFEPLVLECKRLGRALRIGVNHGSLSDRIVNRFGNTPRGMVESAIEFLHPCRKHDFHNLKLSLKSSNPGIMVRAYRLLVATLSELGPDWHYPLHLGVTEAGEGVDGRIKSAIGIGALLYDGLGDTIRVSLAEDPVVEIPVCKALIKVVANLTAIARTAPPDLDPLQWPVNPVEYARRESVELALPSGTRVGGQQPVRVVVPARHMPAFTPGHKTRGLLAPEAVYEKLPVLEVDPTQPFHIPAESVILTVRDGLELSPVAAFRMLAARLQQKNARNPILIKDTLLPDSTFTTPEYALLHSAVVLGTLLIDGIGDLVMVRAEADPHRALELAYNILQAAGCRSFKTDYIICPSCGRTLFDIQTVAAQIKARTSHLAGVKIAIMGCVVNGPGEMADADFGYVGGAPGKVNLYVGHTPVKFNIPQEEAVDHLIELIKAHGRWVDPPHPDSARPAEDRP